MKSYEFNPEIIETSR